jgi:integrase/recombinase XerD
MARVAKRKRRPTQMTAAPAMPIDPNGLLAWERRFITWMNTRNYAAGTIKSRDIALRRFIEWCDGRSLYRPEEITKPILERYQRHLYLYRRPTNGKAWTFRTQRLHLEPIKLWFRWLTRNNVTLWNPASELDLPRVVKHLPRQAFTQQEVESILALPDIREVLGLRDRALMEVAYSTGMRRSELAGLSIYDFDEQRRTLLIRHGKGDKQRMVPVGERASLWLRKYLDESRSELAIEPDDGHLFLGRVGEPIGSNYISQLVREYVVKAGIKKPGSVHLLRHSAAVQMLDHGCDIRFIKELLGHADLKTTETYTRVSIEQLARIHALTHPGASLEFTPPPRVEGLRVAVAGDQAELQAVIDADDLEDDDD